MQTTHYDAVRLISAIQDPGFIYHGGEDRLVRRPQMDQRLHGFSFGFIDAVSDPRKRLDHRRPRRPGPALAKGRLQGSPKPQRRVAWASVMAWE